MGTIRTLSLTVTTGNTTITHNTWLGRKLRCWASAEQQSSSQTSVPHVEVVSDSAGVITVIIPAPVDYDVVVNVGYEK